MLWANQEKNVIYRWGGDGSYGTTTVGDDNLHLWVFTPDDNGGGKWGIQSPGNPSVFSEVFSAGSAGGAVCGGVGFSLGGFGSAASDHKLGDNPFGSNLPLPGILQFDFSTSKWSNESTTPLTNVGSVIRDNLACLDDVKGISGKGMLVAVGGAATSAQAATDNAIQLIDMSNITVYDSKNNKWFSQKATGDVPEGRTWAAMTGAVAKDGSFNIYMYGGDSPTNGILSDISILSLPAFHWFKTDIVSPPRVLAKMVVAKNQIISMGGVPEEFNWTTPDPWVETIGVLDMQKLQWKTSFDPNAPTYDSPQMVKDYYKSS